MKIWYLGQLRVDKANHWKTEYEDNFELAGGQMRGPDTSIHFQHVEFPTQ